MYRFRFIFYLLSLIVYSSLFLAIIAGERRLFNEEGITLAYLLCIAVSC
jgi:hypothetical protein